MTMLKTGEMDAIYQKAWNGERLSQDEGTALWDADLLTLGRLADRRRRELRAERGTDRDSLTVPSRP